jgi:ABC-2 type transport system permease protein
MPGALALAHDTLHGYRVIPLLQTRDTSCWNELETLDFASGKSALHPGAGEQAGGYTTMLALTRTVGDREQRIVVAGDADCISNAELLMQRPGIRSTNFSLITGVFRWLARDEFPITITRPTPDDKLLRLDNASMAWVKVLFMICVPLLLASRGGWCLFRRRRR